MDKSVEFIEEVINECRIRTPSKVKERIRCLKSVIVHWK